MKTVLVTDPDRRGMVRWEDYSASVVDPRELDREPVPQALFNTLEAPLTDGKLIATMEKDFMDWVYRTAQVTVHANETLKLYAGPQVSSAEFHTQCADKTRKGCDDELKKITGSINTKIETLQEKLDRKERELQADQAELTQRRLEEGGTILEVGASLFGFGRKRSLTTPISKHRQASRAKADVQETMDTVNDLKKQITDLENEKAKTLDEANKRWEDIANQVNEIPVVPQKKDVLLDLFGVAWIPYYGVEAGGEKMEIPGYISK
jgi:Skp family chaperone for outer membrane proteins